MATRFWGQDRRLREIGFNALWVLAPSLEGTHGISSGLVGLWSWEIEVVKGSGRCGGQ